jgi:hypothetical protein
MKQLRFLFLHLVAILISVGNATASEKPADAIFEAINKKHHLAMLERGLLTAQANWVASIGQMLFYNRRCGDTVVSMKQIEDQRAEVVSFFRIPAEVMANESESIATELSDAFGSADKETLTFVCQQARAK